MSGQDQQAKVWADMVERRRFLLAAGTALCMAATDLPARAASWPVEDAQKIVDTAIDIVARSGMISLTDATLQSQSGVSAAVLKRAFPDRADLIVAMVGRIFMRRVIVIDAALEAAKEHGVKALLEATSSLMPTPDWVAYWDIAFAIRADKAVQDRLQKATNSYDKDREAKLMGFFPANTDPFAVDFAMMQFDGLGMMDTLLPSPQPRTDQIAIMQSLITRQPH